MKTSQSFPFYPSDFTSGTLLMEPEEVGAYIRLLCYQWEQGVIPSTPAALLKITGLPARKLGGVLDKFASLPCGGLLNKRLEAIRLEREAYQKRQSEFGKKGGRGKANPSDENTNPTKGSLSKPFAENEGSLKPPSPSPSPSPSPLTPIAPTGQSLALDKNPEPPASPSLGLDKPKQQKELSPLQIRIGSWFGRRPTTGWSEKELKAWGAIKINGTSDHVAIETLAEFVAIEAYYTAKIPAAQDFRRRDLLTLLNNWNGEIDRAMKFKPEAKDERDF